MEVLDRLIADLLVGRARWDEATDAQAFLVRARLHGVSALLHAALRRNAASVPAPVLEALRKRALQSAAVDLARRRELEGLLGSMASAGVRPILLKGTPLAYTHYAEPGLRERADVDVLAHPAERERLFRMLEAHGYRRTDGAGGHLASAEGVFGKDDSPLVLDVHWRIKSSPLLARVLEFDELEAQCVPIPALGPHARAPGGAHATLLAAIHRAAHHQSPFYADGVAHRGDRLIWLYDLHLLVPALTAAQSADLAERADRHRVAGLVLDALQAARETFGTMVPPELAEALTRAAARPEAAMAFLRAGRRHLFLAELRALPGWGLRLGWLREHVLPPADYMLRKYGTQRRWLLPALYVRRALGWLTR